MAKPAPNLHRGRTDLRSQILWAACVFLVLAVFKMSTLWAGMSGRIFDQISTLSPARPSEPGIVMVALDEPSFSEVKQQWPWPRFLHGDLLQALRKAGAKAIAFDIVFAEQSLPSDDQDLAAQSLADTVFATDETYIENPNASMWVRTEPLPLLLKNGATTGVASIRLDGDGVVRTLPAYEDSFMRRLLQAAGEDTEKRPKGERLIQYFGPNGSYPRASYYQALDPEQFLPPDFFKDKVVIVGLALQVSPDISEGSKDAFSTAYTTKTGQLTYGSEVHATIYDNYKNGLSILNPPNWLGYFLLAFGMVLGFLAARMHRPVHKALAGFGILFGLFLLCWVSLKYGRVWFSLWDLGAGAISIMLVMSARDFALERKMRGEIQGAFSQYLAPAMVNKIIADPTQLNLGGEKKTLTIMFADIRGFTGISEHFKNDPQGLTRLINEILTPLADIVMANGGTIDKFIGDCIMAFWNAPLDDPDHAQNALKAAQEMLGAIDKINEDISDQIADNKDLNIRIGIGINTGDCVVGNMGSKTRFDYSVLGDAVNVAARLEGMTKEYKTSVIFGENTYALLPAQNNITDLGTIKVRGRSQPLNIYTL